MRGALSRLTGEKVGLKCRANDVLTDIVMRVERGELKPVGAPTD